MIWKRRINLRNSNLSIYWKLQKVFLSHKKPYDIDPNFLKKRPTIAPCGFSISTWNGSQNGTSLECKQQFNCIKWLAILFSKNSLVIHSIKISTLWKLWKFWARWIVLFPLKFGFESDQIRKFYVAVTIYSPRTS